ncbi:MarR family winged helix-turn-helix transcriptional regulator [Rhodococcus ruber]|nr:MarR family transcriptional regulator [Rhodococcus ruber]AUM20111.1 MarR family transcriptional regulator [Rhodococcus ruber]MBD8057306.1 MarR family transcriptional regulator [Rhodococcus ruber]MCF8786744.1 MarR family transcriptional regulator [Rhodococcus ruber]
MMSDDQDVVERIARLLPPWLAAVEAVNEVIAREAGIGPSDLACLHEVIVDGPVPAGELSRRLRLTTGAITHMIDRLTEAGMARRVRDSSDRRRVLVEAVPEARDRMLDRYKGLDAQTRATLAGFTSDEQAVIARFIEASLHDTQALLDETP